MRRELVSSQGLAPHVARVSQLGDTEGGRTVRTCRIEPLDSHCHLLPECRFDNLCDGFWHVDKIHKPNSISYGRHSRVETESFRPRDSAPETSLGFAHGRNQPDSA